MVTLVRPKQEVEQKSEWFSGVKFCSNFKIEWENGVWTKIRFLASGFANMRQFHFDFYCLFLIFLDRNVSKWFSQSIHLSLEAYFFVWTKFPFLFIGF